jgi:hypothetical protein
MIIVKLTGGLGNQMFQYAAARRLAHANQTEVKIDTRWFKTGGTSDFPREYALDVFSFTQFFASEREIAAITKSWKKIPAFFLRRVVHIEPPLSLQSHFIEPHFHFDERVLRLRGDVYLDGYWQSEKYFRDVREIILQDFTIKPEPDARNRKLLDRIDGVEAASLHVRRGDYVASPATNKVHGTCSLDYYRHAVREIASRVSNPVFFVFSDDAAWAREHLTMDAPSVFVDHNGPEKAYEDMRLMTRCRHHIIANSSFSWWGAWLCRHPGKIVIAPRKWFNAGDINTKDIIPDQWIRV